MGRAAVLAAALGLVALGCRGDSATRAERVAWAEANAAAVESFALDVASARAAVNQGERTVVLTACRQVQTAVGQLPGRALPVPDDEVDDLLGDAVRAAQAGVRSCLEGATASTSVPGQDLPEREDTLARFDEATRLLESVKAAVQGWRG